MRQMEKEKMSGKERIEDNIEKILKDIGTIDADIEKTHLQLKSTDLSEDDKTKLEENLESLRLDRMDLCIDLAMLEELLAKIEMKEEEESSYYEDDRGGGLDWNESGYFD